MSKQITVRIPDDLAEFIDGLVAQGVVASRAEAVSIALIRERRRRTALRDVEILQQHPTDPELDALAQHTAAHPVPLDD